MLSTKIHFALVVALSLCPLTTKQQTLASFTPAWGVPSGTPASSYISDGVSHITSIVVNYFDNTFGPFPYSFQFYQTGGAAVETSVPSNTGCTFNSSPKKIIVPATQTITKIEAWTDSNYWLLKVTFTFSDSTSQSATSPLYSSSNKLSTFTTPAGSEFIGMKGLGAGSGSVCKVPYMEAYYRPSIDCTLSS